MRLSRRFWRGDEITIAQKLAKRVTRTSAEGGQVEAV
jgi:hypothetical protein